jgi:hypothetical protein
MNADVPGVCDPTLILYVDRDGSQFYGEMKLCSAHEGASINSLPLSSQPLLQRDGVIPLVLTSTAVQ